MTLERNAATFNTSVVFFREIDFLPMRNPGTTYRKISGKRGLAVFLDQ